MRDSVLKLGPKVGTGVVVCLHLSTLRHPNFDTLPQYCRHPTLFDTCCDTPEMDVGKDLVPMGYPYPQGKFRGYPWVPTGTHTHGYPYPWVYPYPYVPSYLCYLLTLNMQIDVKGFNKFITTVKLQLATSKHFFVSFKCQSQISKRQICLFIQ